MNIEQLKSELVFRTSRSSGSGGQHVNKVSTKVALFFHIANSTGLTESEKAMIQQHLKHRINKAGILRLSSQNSRSQYRNKKNTIDRFFDMIKTALRPESERKLTQPSSRGKAERLRKKRLHSLKKKSRQKVNFKSDVGLSLC